MNTQPFHHHSSPHQEVPIRALGVSLVAIAAVAASMTLARHRGEPIKSDHQPVPDEASVPPAVPMNLDAIRTAGL